MSNEQKTETTEFDALAEQAAQIDALAGVAAEPAPGEEAAQLPAPIDYLTESRGAVDMVAALVVGFAPKAAEIWDDGTKNRVSAALAPVLEKYGFTFGAMPPEMLLVIVAGPPLWQSARLVADEVEAKRAKKAEAEAKAAEQSGEVKQVFRPGAKQQEEAPHVPTHPQMALYR